MAIEPVKKITVIAHKSIQDQVVDALARIGTVHVERVVSSELLASKELTEGEVRASRHCSFGESQVEFLLGFLKKHASEKPGFLKTMIKDKYPMTVEEFFRAGESFDLELVYDECFEMARGLISLRDGKAALERERDELEYWTGLQMPLDEIKGDTIYGLMPVRVALFDLEVVLEELEEEAPESCVEEVGRRGLWASCLVLYHPLVEETVLSLLSRHRCQQVTLPGGVDEPRERLDQVKREITALERRRRETLVCVERNREHVPALEVMREYLVNQRRRIEVMTSFGVTDSTVAIEGWVAERGIGKTVERLGRVSDDIAFELTEPGEGDNPPVSITNPRWARPFEILVKLFGTPNNREYDPTLIVAISFMVFFGFCIGDVGYGACLIVAFLLMRRYLPLGKKAKDLLLVLTYGAAWAMVIGVFTGSWFGIETKQLPQALRSVAFLDPLRRTVLAMSVAMGIGLVHMLAGTLIEFRDNWRGGNRADALIDQGLIFLLFVGGGAAAALAAAKVVPKSVPLLVGGAAILGMLLLLGRSARSIPGKVLNGLYETYGTVVGFISDTISYVRLFALGLATFIIGLVINTMAGMVMGMAPVVGILLMLIILLIGHTFNVAINLLGAFVHPLRLEFVEFFGKFYDDGGREFRPLGIESKIVMIEDQGGG